MPRNGKGKKSANASGRSPFFKGSRALLLDGFAPKMELARKNGTMAEVRAEVERAYWGAYSWLDGAHNEPSGPPPENEVLTPEEQVEKAKMVKFITCVSHKLLMIEERYLPFALQKLYSRWKYAGTKAKAKQSMVVPWMKKICKPEGPLPRIAQPHQFYMSHPQYRGMVKSVYDAEAPPNQTKLEGINFRNGVARRLYSREPQAVKDMLLIEAAHDRDDRVREYRAAQNGAPIGLPSDIDQ